jgi:hypothetical protein
MITQNRPASLVRPVKKRVILADGTYSGEILEVLTQEYPNKFKEGEMREVLTIRVKLQTEEAGEVVLDKVSTLNWNTNGDMMKTLTSLEMVPEEGEALNLEDFAGMKVSVTTQVVEKGDTIYTNIVSIKRQANPVAPFPRKVKKPS